MKHWKAGGIAGNAQCAFNAGLAYDRGKFGVAVDKEEATFYYRIAAGLGNPAAMVNLSLLLQKKDPGASARLMEQAAAAGDPGAAALEQMLQEIGKDDGVWDAIIADPDGTGRTARDLGIASPVRFTPPTTKRPRLVVHALRDGFKCSQEDAEDTTSGLYGFGTYRALEQAIERGPHDSYDEDVDAETREKRLAWHASVLRESTNMTPELARRAATALRATSATGKPSLRQLKKELRGDNGANKTGDPLRDALRAFGRINGLPDPTSALLLFTRPERRRNAGFRRCRSELWC
jgi:TPR repeat protein